MTIDEVFAAIQKILDDNSKQITCELTFPQYKTYPSEVKLALEVLKNHQMKIVIALEDREKEPEAVG